MQHKSERVNFGSKLGAILAAAGSAVGLGNIWRFPYETGNHGGAAFILIYLGCVIVFGLPIMIAEASKKVGRASAVCRPSISGQSYAGFREVSEIFGQNLDSVPGIGTYTDRLDAYLNRSAFNISCERKH